MIHTFSAKNFQSFEDEVGIDFRVDDNAPKSSGYIATSYARLSLVEVVIGPNASGKTTALKALAFLQWFLVSSFRQDRDELPFMPFAGNSKKVPTELRAEFEFDDQVYIYTLKLRVNMVLHESLYVRNLTRLRTTSKKLFSRGWDNNKECFDVDDASFDIPEQYWRSKDLKNTSIIGAASRFGHEHAYKIINYWKRFQTNVDIEDRYINHTYGAYRALQYYQGHSNSKRRAEEDVRKYADLGIESFGNNMSIMHKFGDKTFKLGWGSESSGTHRYIHLRRMMDEVFENGGFMVVDEFDAFLHPKMLKSLVGKFSDPKLNKAHAQLLMTVQDILILNDLNKYQINLTEKNNRGATSIRRLDSIKGIRPNENFLAKYMKGVYGASWPIWPKDF
jgi:uncharacterized protein